MRTELLNALIIESARAAAAIGEGQKSSRPQFGPKWSTGSIDKAIVGLCERALPGACEEHGITQEDGCGTVSAA
jgi:hypothetical protein